MNKEEFLEKLRKKLSILEESEIEDIITEYDGYIEEKIKKGSSEEEAVKSMGNIDELARELLSAYKIKNPSEKEHDGLNNLVDSFMNIFDRIVSVFAHKSFNEIVKFVIELIFIFLIIAVCKIPFEIIEGMGRNIFSSLGNTSYHVVFGIWNFVLEFAYLIFAILLFIKIFESRYLNEEFESVFKEDVKPKKEKESQPLEKEEKVVKEKNRNKNVREHQSFGIVDALTKICILFIKFIMLFFLLGVVCYIVGMAMALGISVYLLIKGVFYFGVYLILISLFALGIVAFIFLFNFIFDHKNKVGALLIVTLISFVMLGVGTGVCALEFASTTIIYNEDEENQKREEYTFTMQSDLVLSTNIFYADNIEIDDTLNDQIKIVYRYNDTYMKIKATPNIEKYNKYSILYAGYHMTSFSYSKDFFDKLISDLKNKTIIASAYDHVEIKVYVSSEVKKQLEENERKYFQRNHSSLEEVCEEIREAGLTLPEYCLDSQIYEDM